MHTPAILFALIAAIVCGFSVPIVLPVSMALGVGLIGVCVMMSFGAFGMIAKTGK